MPSLRCRNLLVCSNEARHQPARDTRSLCPLGAAAVAPELRLTPEQFELVCAETREAVLELAADGHMIRMPQVGGETSLRNSALTFQLAQFVRQSGGWIAFATCSGFRLPNDSVLSTDASLVRLERLQALTPKQRRGFAPLCPDLVVELASASDEGARGVGALRRKMNAYQANGVRLGWLLLPYERAVEIWPVSGEPQRIEQAEVLEGGPEFPGLRLELAEIWNA